LPDHIYPDAHIYDLVVIPGGPGYSVASGLLRLMHWIERASRRARLVVGVGGGLFLLGSAGLLAGQTVAAVPGLLERFPTASLSDEPVVGSGKYLTIASHEQARPLARLIIERCQRSPTPGG
jgi:putative intracellular protease/amidase